MTQIVAKIKEKQTMLKNMNAKKFSEKKITAFDFQDSSIQNTKKRG